MIFDLARILKKTGADLGRRLQALDESQLNRYLAHTDGGISPDSLPNISRAHGQIEAFGIEFSVVGGRIFEVDLHYRS